MISILKGLNTEQKRAVCTTEGALLIIAGAGSGKTSVITSRIAYMLSQGIPAQSILALTFTNKAAAEMRNRVSIMTQTMQYDYTLKSDTAKNSIPAGAGKNNVKDTRHFGKKSVTLNTFHSFGLSILRRHGRLLGYRPRFTVYDVGDQVSAIKAGIQEIGMDISAMNISALRQEFSAAKLGQQECSAANAELYDVYCKHLLTYNAVDFDDLIAQPIRLLCEHENVRQAYINRFRYIMVDEFQDTSASQYTLLHMLGSTHGNVCVVGDDDQSIYSWRGAHYGNIEHFERDFPNRQEVRLEQNYRSTGQILAAANALIVNNTKRKNKKLRTDKIGTPVMLSTYDNDQEEACSIAAEILQIAGKNSVSLYEFGILVRTRNQLRALEEGLRSENMPYHITGGQSFFQRTEIKDITAYLRLCLNPDDSVSLLRIINTPRRGIGRKAIEHLHAIADAKKVSLYSAIALAIHGKAAHDISAGALDAMQDFFELVERYRDRFLHIKHENTIIYTEKIQRKKAAATEAAATEAAATEVAATEVAEANNSVSDSPQDALDNKTIWTKPIARITYNLIQDIDYHNYLVREFPDSERTAKIRQQNLRYLLGSIQRYESNPDTIEPSLYEYLNRISLDDGAEEEGRKQVQISTIHAAKGLEWDVVFLAGVEEGILPHQRSIDEDPTNAEEERRLFYVAITRAKQQLHMSWCRQRLVRNKVIDTLPSIFLQEIPDLCTEKPLPTDPFAALRKKLKM